MPMKKRPRACDACHIIKIKCELGSDGGDPPCARCVRLGKDCSVSPPKRQKDRVAELEAQVEALTKLLGSQNIQSEGTEELLETKAPSKKRRLEDSTTSSPLVEDGVDGTNSMAAMDRVLPISMQKTILHRHVNEIMPEFTLVPLAATSDYDELRREKPWLLQAIIYGSCYGLLSSDAQDEVAKVIVDLFAPGAIFKTERSIEIFQSIQAIALWFRFPKFRTTIPMQQFSLEAAAVAKEIGISGPESSPCRDNSSVTKLDAEFADVWRTWLVCYLICANWSMSLRQANPLSWGAHEDLTLSMLEYWPHGMTTDRLLAQYVRAERLCERITTLSLLSEPTAIIDLASPATQLTINACCSLTMDWKAQIPQHLLCPILKFWEHVAMLYSHECILHTPSNKGTFAAPYLADRLSVTDFPAPAVTQEHINSIIVLQENSQGLIDTFSSLETSTLMSLPPIIFAARIAYSLLILMKLYIAMTASGNTFGGFLNPQSLKIDEYIQKVIHTSEKAREIDPSCGNARVLDSCLRLRDWLSNYRATQNVSMPLSNSDGKREAALGNGGLDVDWNYSTLGEDSLDYGLDSFFSASLHDFGLSILQTQ